MHLKIALCCALLTTLTAYGQYAGEDSVQKQMRESRERMSRDEEARAVDARLKRLESATPPMDAQPVRTIVVTKVVPAPDHPQPAEERTDELTPGARTILQSIERSRQAEPPAPDVMIWQRADGTFAIRGKSGQMKIYNDAKSIAILRMLLTAADSPK